MKNSKWREYAGRRPFSITELPLPGRPAKFADRSLKTEKKNRFWDCAWCSNTNAIGYHQCEKCQMPRPAAE